MSTSVGHILDFIEANKGAKTFKEYNRGQIALMIIEAIEDKCLYIATDLTDNISGMILAKLSVPSKTLWIEENLSMSLVNLRLFAIKAKEQFPDYTFTGFKCGKDRNYNKLVNRLTK